MRTSAAGVAPPSQIGGPPGPERQGRGRDVVEFQDLPVEGGSPAPQLAPQRDGLVQAGETALPRHLGQRIERLSEAAGEARADRDREPAARQQIDRRQGLGGLDRPAQEGQQRAGAQRGPFRYRGERGQHRECLDARADQGVVDEERGETQLFGPDGEGDQLSRVAVRAPLGLAGREKHTNVHADDPDHRK